MVTVLSFAPVRSFGQFSALPSVVLLRTNFTLRLPTGVVPSLVHWAVRVISESMPSTTHLPSVPFATVAVSVPPVLVTFHPANVKPYIVGSTGTVYFVPLLVADVIRPDAPEYSDLNVMV